MGHWHHRIRIPVVHLERGKVIDEQYGRTHDELGSQIHRLNLSLRQWQEVVVIHVDHAR